MMPKESRILIVEDSKSMLMLLERELRAIGFEDILRASDGEEAVKYLLQNEKIDLLISDWQMPKMDGLQVLEFVRKSPTYAQTPFVFLTSQGDRDTVLQAIRLGVDGYILKPFTRKSVAAAIEKASQRNAVKK